jgi:hypothetical protein
MRNSGNEAKKYLKTKDITFLNAAILAHFAHRLAPIAPQKEQKRRILQKRTETCESRGDALTMTSSRLDDIGICIGTEPTGGGGNRAGCDPEW